MGNDVDPVAFARAMKALDENMKTAQFTEFELAKARLALARFQAAKAAGFTEDQALVVCTRSIEL